MPGACGRVHMSKFLEKMENPKAKEFSVFDSKLSFLYPCISF